jgi:precorrin-6Y C5,15-methyltransferase (decarboxylating)
MKIHIVGMGMGSLETLTHEALAAVKNADVLIGAERLLQSLPDGCSSDRHPAITPEDIYSIITNKVNAGAICILMSGDTGFYSGAKRLLEKLEGRNVSVLPGISSVQYLAAKLCRSWQDWKLVSAHGKDINPAAIVRENAETFFLTGGVLTVAAICKQLADAGFDGLTVTVGERLGSDREAIRSGTAAEFTRLEGDKLAVLLVDNPSPRLCISYGLPDEAFTRGRVPMTKSEVRSAILSKLRLKPSDILYDVGAGTGSVSVEAALLLRNGHVWAFEREAEGCILICENAKKHHAVNLTCVEGEAPEAFESCPVPDAAFIGGSGGRLEEVLETLLRLNPSVRLVVSAVTLETLAEATKALTRLPIINTEIVQLSVSHARPVGGYHLMTAQNPVFIISGDGTPD